MGLEQDFRGHLVSYQQLVHAALNTALWTPAQAFSSSPTNSEGSRSWRGRAGFHSPASERGSQPSLDRGEIRPSGFGDLAGSGARLAPQSLRPTTAAQLAPRQRVQQDRAWHHECRGQHIGIAVYADAQDIRNDQLERAGRDDHSQGDRDGEVRDAEDVPEDRRFPPLSRAGRQGDRRRHGEQAGQHIASSCRQRPQAGQQPTQPVSEPLAAEDAVKLKSDEPGRRHRIEQLSHPLRQQQQRSADDHRQEDRRWQQRQGGGARAEDTIDGRCPGDSGPKREQDHDRQPSRATLARSQVGPFKAEPQAERDESMDHQPNGQGRKAALRKHWQRVDQPRPQYREWDGPKQAAPSGTRRDDSSGNSFGGHRRSSCESRRYCRRSGLAVSKPSGKSGPTAMYSWSIIFCLANGRPSMIVCASATSLVSSNRTTPRPSPREYHSRIFPLR